MKSDISKKKSEKVKEFYNNLVNRNRIVKVIETYKEHFFEHNRIKEDSPKIVTYFKDYDVNTGKRKTSKSVPQANKIYYTWTLLFLKEEKNFERWVLELLADEQFSRTYRSFRLKNDVLYQFETKEEKIKFILSTYEDNFFEGEQILKEAPCLKTYFSRYDILSGNLLEEDETSQIEEIYKKLEKEKSRRTHFDDHVLENYADEKFVKTYQKKFRPIKRKKGSIIKQNF